MPGAVGTSIESCSVGRTCAFYRWSRTPGSGGRPAIRGSTLGALRSRGSAVSVAWGSMGIQRVGWDRYDPAVWTRRRSRAQGAAECTANQLEVRPIEGVDARQDSDCGERLSSGLNSARRVFGGGGNGGVLRPVLWGSQGRRHAKWEEAGRHHVSSEGPQLPARVQPGANTMYTIYGIQITFAESGYMGLPGTACFCFKF